MLFLIILVFGFVIGIVVVNALRTESMKPLIITAAAGLVIGLFISMIRVVPAGHVGIIDFFGRVSPRALNSGINLVNPLARVINMSIRTQEIKEAMNVPSKEGLTITLDASILYRLDPEKAVEIYKTVGPYYRDVVVVPQYRAAVRGVTVSFEAKALYTSERETLARSIDTSLKELVAQRGIIIESVLLRAITLPPTVSAAVEQKLKAEQDAERMKFVLQREKQEAERKRVEAEGTRDAQTIISESLSEQYLNYLWINTLNQNPSVIYVATEANMPIFRTTASQKSQ